MSAQAENDKNKAELREIRAEIKANKQKQQQQEKALEQAQQALKEADFELAKASQSTHSEQQELDKLSRELKNVKEQQQQLTAQKRQQQQQLAAQLKAAYQVGGHDYLQLLLNQQDTQKLERLLTYYQYFNTARVRQLTALKATLSSLEQLNLQHTRLVENQQSKVESLKLQQEQFGIALAKQKQTVKSLNQALADQQQQLSYLSENEKSLSAALAKLAEQRRQREMEQQQAAEREAAEREAAEPSRVAGSTENSKKSSLPSPVSRKTSSAKSGKLPWPIKGRLMQTFGESQGGELTTRGILIAAKAGSSAQAVADGQVIYADWLKGYGWVIVIEHGNGLMSLYGHNQSLLKTPGDKVKVGEQVALVGQSGGQEASGLYFEIRQKGIAVNPLHWLRKP